MNEKFYVSTANYYPGRQDLPAGTVFTEEQWIEAGGKATGLAEHIAKGYITEAKQVKPAAPAPKKEAPKVDAPIVDGSEGSEDDKEKEKKPPVVDNQKTAPTGLWCYTAEELEPLPLEALNTMYKDTAKKAGLKTPRAFKDKPALIKKMTSEGSSKD